MRRVSINGKPIDSEEFGLIGSNNSPAWRKIAKSYLKPFESLESFGHSVASLFPFISWLPKYNPKQQLFGDVMAGIMTAFFNITQGMAYAILAGLPPVNGLYSTFLGAIIFPFFTSWMHGSLGPFAIVSVMCKAAQEQTLSKYEFANGSLLPIANIEDLDPSVIVSTLTFLVGLCCLLFAVLKLEFFAEYFSEALVSGFITAAAVQVLVTQLDTILGVAKPHSHGFGYMFKNIYQVMSEVPNTNIITFGIFVVSLLYLCFCKFVLKLILKKIWPSQKFIIPYELILVVTMISTAYILQLDVNHNVQIVGTVPTGLPIPRLPHVGLFKDLIFDAIALSIVIIAVHLSLSRIFCVKKKYQVDDNQELYAYGFTLSLVGLAPVFPPATGLGRPFIIDECGGSSPLVNIVSGALVLTVLLVFGPLMYYLPLSALSAIVVIALRSLFVGFFQLPRLWRLCKWDFSIWVVTFCAAILSDVIYGLAIGVVFELFAVSARTQWPHWTAKFNKNTESEHIAVFKLESMLLFTNATIFKKKVRQTYVRWPKSTHSSKPKIFVFDCSAMCDIDYVGLKQFNETILDLRKDGCLVYFLDIHDFILKGLKKLSMHIDSHHVFSSMDEVLSEASRYGLGFKNKRKPKEMSVL